MIEMKNNVKIKLKEIGLTQEELVNMLSVTRQIINIIQL